jgi:pimeloyl-ACP methyl ester carboxylesterase
MAGQEPPGLDRSRDNLVHAPGYPTATTPAIRTERIGAGATPLVFIAGWGFAADAFRDFARGIAGEYTSYLVTLPGFGGTPGWPMPADSISHSTTPWIRLSAAAVARMMADRAVTHAIVVGHFIIGSHVALELAQRHPERVGGVVLAGAELSRYWPSRADTTGRTPATPAQRAASVDRWMVPQFFRYVTDSTWHASNYLPHTFSVDSTRAARLWAEQAAVPLPIMIRYLSDFYATEFAPRLDSIRSPMLILEPGFNAKILADARTPYLTAFFHDSWEPARGRRNVAFRAIADAAVHLWLDQPERFRSELEAFTARTRRADASREP